MTTENNSGFGGAPPAVTGSSKPLVPVNKRVRTFLTQLLAPLEPYTSAAGFPDIVTGHGTDYVPSDSPAAQKTFNEARLRYLYGSPTYNDLNVLVAANEISPSDVRAFTKSGGGGLTASESANIDLNRQQFAEQKRSNRVAEAVAQIKALTDQQQTADARLQAGQTDTLNALPYMAPADMTYFPGFGPGDQVQIPIQHTAFDTKAAARGNAMDPVVAQRLAELAQMIGAGA